ncbi:MAG: hypothetical protein AB7V62_01685 [Thermoleophilia bacterium]
MTGAAPGAQHPQRDGDGAEAGGDLPRHGEGDDVWFVPAPGTRVRQTVTAGPFVVQHREDLGAGAVKLTRHRGATATVFEVVGYEERSEIGLPCHVVLLRDEADDRRYVVDTGLCGPGLPADAFSAGTTSP